MSESIEIQNFAGIANLKLEINKITILIGPQAAGKSVIAKLLFYFKNFVLDILHAAQRDQSEGDLPLIFERTFREYFPAEGWPEKDFLIRYTQDNSWIQVDRNGSKETFTIAYSDEYRNLLTDYRSDVESLSTTDELRLWFHRQHVLPTRFVEHARKTLGDSAAYRQIFIPARRSFFALPPGTKETLRSADAYVSSDPFTKHFGPLYESAKRSMSLPPHLYGADKQELVTISKRLVELILVANYVSHDEKDYLQHIDGRRIPVGISSSGQQEVLPLASILQAIALDVGFNSWLTIYIEEPEAHLFPTTQKRVVELISTVFNSHKWPLQFVITTHSPYILTSINNLLQASQEAERSEGERLKAVYEIVPKEQMLKTEEVAAYSIAGGGGVSIKDEETGLIGTNVIDEVSDELAIQFDKLLSVAE